MEKFIIASWVLLLVICTNLSAQDAGTFYQTDQIQKIAIEFEQEKWSYLLDSLRYNGDDVLLGKVEINGYDFEDVGIRYASSRAIQVGSKRNDFEILLDFIKKGQNYDGLRKVRLSIALRDPSMVREVLSYEIAGNYLPSPQANYAELNINGEDVGLFVNIEAVDYPFLKRYYGEEVGHLYLSDPAENSIAGCTRNAYGSLAHESNVDCYDRNFEDLTGGGFAPLAELATALKDNPGAIDEILDVDQLLWMLAINNVLVNLYSYTGRHSQNYYLYADREGKFHPVMGDMNLSFGSFKNLGTGSDLKLKDLQELDPLVHESDPGFPLISRIFSQPINKKVYLSHVLRIYKDFIANERYLTRAAELQGQIRSAFEKDPYKTYTLEQFDQSMTETIGKRSQIPGLKQLMAKRSNYIRKNRDLRVLPPAVTDVAVVRREQFSNQQLSEFRIQAKVEKFPKRVSVFYRFDSKETFMKVTMKDDGESHDGEANDALFGAIISPNSPEAKIEYYILAENSKAVSFNPSNYVQQLHSATLEEINR